MESKNPDPELKHEWINILVESKCLLNTGSKKELSSQERGFIGPTLPRKKNIDILSGSDSSIGDDCLENVGVESNQGNSDEISF